jgi:PEP-CTERM motif
MRHFCALLIVLLSTSASFGGVLYNNTQDTHASTGLGGSQQVILIDDVLIPLERDPLGLPLAITQINVLVVGSPGSSANFSMWDFPVEASGQNASPGLPDSLIASTSHTFTNPFEQVSFGNGTTTLFTVTPNFTAVPGYGLIYLGLMGPSSPTTDWEWANGPDFNLPTAYLYNVTAGQIFLNTSPPGFPPNLSYDMSVVGQAVPEPSSLLLFAAALLGPIGYTCTRKRVRSQR